MVSDLLMVTAPKPPGSRQLISPPIAVLEIAPAKVLHGAVRLHGLASSPTPETQVRVAWPRAVRAKPQRRAAIEHNFGIFSFSIGGIRTLKGWNSKKYRGYQAGRGRVNAI